MSHRCAHVGLMLACLTPTVVQAVEESAPQGEVIVSDIVIDGTEEVHPDRIRFRLRSRVGAPLSAYDVAEDVRTINTMGPFIDGRSQIEYLDGDHVRLIFTVEELPLIAAVRYEGISFWAKQGLDDKIESAPGRYRNPLIIESDRRALEENFRRKGWVDTTVRVREYDAVQPGLVNVVFDIDIGTPVKIADTIYQNLPEDAHKYFLDKNLLFNTPGRPFNREMLDLDGKIVVNALQDLGYLDASLSDIEVGYYDDVAGHDPRRRNGPAIAPDGFRNDRVQITFTVEPGDRYRLGSISFIGNTVISEEELRAGVAVPDGEWFLRSVIDEELLEARTRIRDLGYARARLGIDRRYNLDTRTVHLTVEVMEGRRYRFGRIDISGNTITKDAAIRRLFESHPGQPYSETAVDESQRQLSRTGLFRNDRLTPLRAQPRFPADRPEEVDLVYELEEAETGRINASFGYVTGTGFIGQLEYTERNFDLLGLITEGRFRGAGQTAGANFSISDESLSTGVNWTNPHLFDSDFFLRTSFQLRQDSDSSLDWSEDRITSSASVGHYFLNRDIRLAVGYRYMDLDVYDVESDAADDVRGGDYYDNQIFADQDFDRTNSRVLPTEGWSIDLHQGLSGKALSSSFDYYELTARGHLFVPLVESALGGVTYLHLRQQNRWVRGLDGDEVPFYNRYYGGGPYPRHRGHDRNRLGPTFERDVNGVMINVRPGGTTEWLTTLELSHPIQGINEGIRAVAFWDVGWIWAAGEEPDMDDLVNAAGFGVRFPMQFPIALDFAWQLDGPEKGEQQVHFSLGGVLF